MIPIRNHWPEATSAAKPAGSLTAADIARLDAKHDEIIMVLRLWHGYGLMAADRALSHWMYLNSVRIRPAGLTQSDSTTEMLRDKAA